MSFFDIEGKKRKNSYRIRSVYRKKMSKQRCYKHYFSYGVYYEGDNCSCFARDENVNS